MAHLTTAAQILVKRYANDRLYDTAAARYVSLADLEAWFRDGTAFVVQDAATGADITRILLA